MSEPPRNPMHGAAGIRNKSDPLSNPERHSPHFGAARIYGLNPHARRRLPSRKKPWKKIATRCEVVFISRSAAAVMVQRRSLFPLVAPSCISPRGGRIVMGGRTRAIRRQPCKPACLDEAGPAGSSPAGAHEAGKADWEWSTSFLTRRAAGGLCWCRRKALDSCT